MTFPRLAKLSALFLLACIFASPAHADPVPEAALDKDFTNCMGNQSPASDPERAQYCNCVRDGMRKWDLDTYGNTAMEAKNAGADQPPDRIAALARECITKVLK